MEAVELNSATGLYAGGVFSFAGGVPARSIARWDGAGWTQLSTGIAGTVYALARYETEAGAGLYVGGEFSAAGGVSASRIARWNGAGWSPVSSGFDGRVAALQSFDDGSGPALYAGGIFSMAGGVNARNVARWDGATWSAVGVGLPYVTELCVFDDGAGPALYAGWYDSSPPNPQGGLAKWNGSTWTYLGPFTGFGSSVRALTVTPGLSGPLLCAGGQFDSVGGVPAGNVATWDGSSWTALGSLAPDPVTNLAMFDDGSGSGPALYATSGHHVWRWDGATWVSAGDVSTGTGAPEFGALAVYDDGSGSGPALFLGGDFTSVEGVPSRSIAKLQGCGHPGIPTCFGDGSAAACPCGNSGSPGQGCDNSASTGGALLVSSGWTSLAHDSLAFLVTGELSSALTLFLQGSEQIAPIPFGDGLRCAGGTLKRLYAKAASGGAASAPQGAELSVSARSAQLNHPIPVAATRVYQTYYRDANPAFCSSPVGSTFNSSSGLRISWLP